MKVDEDGARERTGYNWGRTGPLGVARALVTLALLNLERNTAEVDAVRDQRWGLARMRQRLVLPWIPVALAALLLVALALALRRRLLELFGLLLVLAPFAVLLATVSNTQIWPKYLMAPMLPVPVLAGVAWVVLAHGAFNRRLPGLAALREHRVFASIQAARERAFARVPAGVTIPILTAVILGVLVTGLVPGWLAPDDPRRERLPCDADFYEVYRSDSPFSSNENLASCFRLMAKDKQRGLPLQTSLYDREWFQQRWEAIQSAAVPPGPPRGGAPAGPPAR